MLMPLPSTAFTSVVLVGCGAVARSFYAPALLEMERRCLAHVVALVDSAPSARMALAQYFPGAIQTDSLSDALVSADLAIIASPPKLHAEQSIFALERGAGVLCEKPMAADLSDAEAMVAAAARTGRPLAVGLVRRFSSGARAIRDLIISQSLGPVTSFEVEEGGPFRWEAASDSFFRPEMTPGGVLYDTGVHTLDLLLWWLGEPVNFDYRDDSVGGLEANCHLRLQYAGGVVGQVRLSRDWTTKNTFRINFARGSVAWQVSQPGQLTLQMEGVGPVLAGELLPMRDNGLNLHLAGEGEGFAQAFLRQLIDVVEAVRTGTPVSIPGPEGLRSLRLIKACYDRRQVLAQPWLSADESKGLARLAQKGAA